MRRAVAVALVLALLAGALIWRPWAGPAGDGARARTILLISVDTLRRDRVGCYGCNAATSAPLTPRMDALAAAGLRFDDARTPVPLTLPGHTTMLAGLPPAATGVRVNAYGRLPERARRRFPLLAEALREAGWRTGAFVSAAPLLALHGLDQGFERYDDSGLDARPPGLSYEDRPGEQTVERALAWIREAGTGARVFLWVHLFEPHAPYAPEVRDPLPDEARYDIDVAHADRIVGRLLDGLEALGRGDAAVLLTADHGEALEELGERTHGYLLGDAVLRVPFLLRGPGIAAGVREDPADLADVAPTLAALGGVPWPAAADVPGEGRDLLAAPAPADRIRVAETLYAHQRYRWAQLLGAVAPGGGTLVDAGGERLHWLDAAPAFEPQSGPRPAPRDALVARLGDVLRAYRSGERKDLIRGGGAVGGYSSGARVAPFLDPQDNARLPDPYDAIPRVAALDRLSDALVQGADPGAVLRQLERMEAADPGNPELAWWRGRALEALALRRGGKPEALARAAAAYLEAWRRGRQDANTLGRAVGVNAAGREDAALALYRDLAPAVPPDGRLALLEARLLRALHRDADADEACERASRLCRRPWEREDLERAQAESVCR